MLHKLPRVQIYVCYKLAKDIAPEGFLWPFSPGKYLLQTTPMALTLGCALPQMCVFQVTSPLQQGQ
jgi:hypothetical protein